MSIETLLEAAKFLELQAQQQQKTREENELRERLRLEQEASKRRAEASPCVQPIRVNHTTWPSESSPERRLAPAPAPHHHHPHPHSAPPPPAPPLPHPSSHTSLPITVIPIPVVASNHTIIASNPTSAPTPLGSPPSAPTSRLTPPPRKDPHSPPTAHHPAPQRQHLPPQLKAEPASLAHANGTKHLLQTYPASVVASTQHALLPQQQPTTHPQQQQQQQQSQLLVQSGPGPKLSPSDDHRGLDGKKRPGGAGTREVHNKLEKNRRAHLKECFETLKRNIPNVDEKKTSNLSVLRSALRYIQTLKRKEKEYEHEMERLAREKISTQQRLAELKNDLSQWMDVIEIDRVLRQTVQPEDDQASTSTASEGEDNMDEDMMEEVSNKSTPPGPLPKVPPTTPDLRKPQHVSVPPKPSQPPPPPPLPLPSVAPAVQPAPASAPIVPISVSVSALPSAPSLSPTPAQAPQQPHAMVAPHVPGLQPTVIAHAAPSHASVIQAVNHVIQAGAKHVAHIAPSPSASSSSVVVSSSSSSSSPVQLAPAPHPIGHITVHPVAHLPALYPQQASAMAQPAVVSHIAHALAAHGQVNGAVATAPPQLATPMPGPQAATVVAKQGPVGAQVVAHHPQLVGQTVLNPVTMVTMPTMPSFPVSTLKLA